MSLFVTDFLGSQFFAGSRASSKVVSRDMPRKSRVVDGPSTFSTASGIPSAWQTSLIVLRFLWHSVDSGGPDG